MQFNKSDLTQSKNLIIALKKARFSEIEGMEVLAFSDLFRWVSKLHDAIEMEVKASEMKSTAMVPKQRQKLREPKKGK